ncbi:MAG: hypothetical protein FD167_3695 [bacterium]|nr:MAG: hypothetical protein FD167_3695 [bacterium]
MITDKLHNDKDVKLLTQQGLDFSTHNKYLFLEADFLLWQAKYLSEIPDFINAEERFLRVVELGNKLNINKLVTSAGTSLAFLYYNQEDNEKAFELTKKILINVTDYKNTQAITLLQLAGLTSFNLHYYEIANSYLKEAIRNSEEMNNPVFKSRSYTFLALTLSEQKNFNQADNFYSKAELEINNIKDETARLESLAWIFGYKAKLRLLESKYNEAIELYENKLSIMDKIHLVNNLEFSQSHEAIAIALSAIGQQEKAQKYSTIAKNYQRIADTNNQRINCLLALVPINCNLKEQ